MGLPKTKASWNSRLAKAETVLVLALCTETLLNPWLASLISVPPVVKTIMKMLLIVGSFGPLFSLISYMIDNGLSVTRNVTTSMFSLPKLGTHVAIIATLFIAFYWSMHHTMPWTNGHAASWQTPPAPVVAHER
jgi:hypothetical protein